MSSPLELVGLRGGLATYQKNRNFSFFVSDVNRIDFNGGRGHEGRKRKIILERENILEIFFF